MNYENPTYDAAGNIVCTLNGYPFQITQNETPDQWADIQAQIVRGLVIAPYVAPTAPTMTPEQAWTIYKAQALAALTRSDNTMARVAEAVALGRNTYSSPDVIAYVNWRRALRALVGASTGDTSLPLPAEPPYPAGT